MPKSKEILSSNDDLSEEEQVTVSRHSIDDIFFSWVLVF